MATCEKCRQKVDALVSNISKNLCQTCFDKIKTAENKRRERLFEVTNNDQAILFTREEFEKHCKKIAIRDGDGKAYFCVIVSDSKLRLETNDGLVVAFEPGDYLDKYCSINGEFTKKKAYNYVVWSPNN